MNAAVVTIHSIVNALALRGEHDNTERDTRAFYAQTTLFGDYLDWPSDARK